MNQNCPAPRSRLSKSFATAILVCAPILCRTSTAIGQMVTGDKMTHFAATFGVEAQSEASFIAVLSQSDVPANILWPDEQPTWTIQLQNPGDSPIKTVGKIDIVHYGTRGAAGEIWIPDVVKLDGDISVPIDVDIPAQGFQNVTVSPKLPATFGGYGIVADLGTAGRRFVFTAARTFKPTADRLQFPSLSLDAIPGDTLPRIGIQAIRQGVSWAKPGDKDYEKLSAELDAKMKDLWQKKITCLLMIDPGAHPQPLGRPRPHLDAQGVMQKTKSDMAWLPSEDAAFQEWVKDVCSKYGWPKGPATAISLWNEPWEGSSISGWGADMLRYRDMYRHMAAGVLAARADAQVQVLVGGCDSSSNAMDKLFCDDSDEFLPIFDFVSMHYQGMSSAAVYKKWRDRKSPMGRVKIWDTESWVANVDDRVGALVAANKSAGYDRAMGVYRGNVADQEKIEVMSAGGKSKKETINEAWSTAASLGAAIHFIGERPFDRLLFQNGLPWVMLFDGLNGSDGKSNPDDSTIVVVGDLGEEFQKDLLLHRTIHSTKHLEEYESAVAKLTSMPTEAPAGERAELVKQLRELSLIHDATMEFDDQAGKFKLFDFYGNPVQSTGGKISVPLDGRGFFLRSDGSPGSFAALTQAVTSSRLDGFECLELIAHDLMAPIESHPKLKITCTNVLNRPVTGTLTVKLGDLKLEDAGPLTFAANETRDVDLNIDSGSSVESNVYPLSMNFDAGADGFSRIKSDLHVNIIAHRTITVDGNLDDWKGVLPQTILSDVAGGASLQEKAWYPYMKYDASVKKGEATGYLAYDENYFYFAAKVADSTPDGGTLRFETRDDDQFFYPATSFDANHKALDWPEGISRFSYRKMYILPCGSSPSYDNVLIAFNAIPSGEDPVAYDTLPGTPPRYVAYRDTDYQFALNKVADKYGGGTEIWRLEVPDRMRKQFFPRQPKASWDGPVKTGKLAVIQDPTTRIEECAIPWSEIPEVKSLMEAGKPVKFSFRVNDGAGVGCMELARDRLISRKNGRAFEADWSEHWANEVEFAFDKASATQP